MRITVYINESLRNVIKDVPKTIIVEKKETISIRQLAVDVGIPPILVVFASVDGIKMNLDANITADANIHLFGTMAGG